MRQRILQIASITVLLIVFGSSVSESLDSWDHTLQTGNDIESVLIILALTAGAAFALAGAVVALIIGTQACSSASPMVSICTAALLLLTSTDSPPLVALRI
jgi:uncharacterized membrane protein YfcA